MLDPRLKEKILEDLEKIEEGSCTLSCRDIARKYGLSKSIVYKLQEEVCEERAQMEQIKLQGFCKESSVESDKLQKLRKECKTVSEEKERWTYEIGRIQSEYNYWSNLYSSNEIETLKQKYLMEEVCFLPVVLILR